MSKHHFCEQCGAPLGDGVKFCEKCGARVVAAGAAEPQRQPVRTESRSNLPRPTEPEISERATGSRGRSRMPMVALAVAILSLVGGAGAWWFLDGRDRFFAGAPSPPAPVPETPAPDVPASPALPPAAPALAPAVEPSPPHAEPVEPIPDPPAPPRPQSPSLISGGDFSQPGAGEIEGDGRRVEGPESGNGAWRFTGPDDMAITLPMKPTSGRGLIEVRYHVMIPTATATDPVLGGVRVRTRLIDRYASSAVSDRVLPASDQLQAVEVEFEDTGSGPYRLGIEAFGFTGSLYLDDIEARQSGAAPGVTIEDWFIALPWFQRLSRSMPAGVTLQVYTADAEEPPGHISVEIREDHAPGSGFDPQVSPRVGIFLVPRDRSSVRYLDPVSAELVPVEVFLRERGISVTAP